MASLRISWLAGFLLSIPCILFYLFLFHVFTGILGVQDAPWWETGRIIYIIGTMLLMIRIIPGGLYGKYTFFGKEVPGMLTAGPHPCPNILHLSEVIGKFSLLYGMYLVDESGKRIIHKEDDSYVFYDQHLPDIKGVVTMSAPVAFVVKTFSFIGYHFLNVKSGELHETPKRLGFRIIILSYLLVIVSSLASPFIVSPKNEKEPTNEENVIVSVQLKMMDGVKFPDDHFFSPHPNAPQNQLVFEEYDGIRYFYAQVPAIKNIVYYNVLSPNSCFPVRSGTKVLFSTKIPPRFAVNMNMEIDYIKKWDELLFLEKVWSWYVHNFSEGHAVPIKGMFGTLPFMWDTLATNQGVKQFHAEALKQSSIREGMLGGVVCF